MSRFKLASNDLPYFKTLHSLAFSRMGISRNQLMTEDDYVEIAKWLKVQPFFVARHTEKDFGYGDKILELINIARVTRRPLAEIYSQSPVRSLVDWSTLDYVNRGIGQYKKASSRYDYTDLLDSFVRTNIAPSLEVLIIDEAQDLSALQWMMVDQMARKAKNVYIAGDDDQAIYRWAGADVEQFIHKEGTVHVLNQSYRIPHTHHAISQELIHRVLDRRAKEFRPREDAGSVRWHRHSEEVDLNQGDWLLLSRTRSGANQLEEEVRQRGLLYVYEGGYSADAKALEAVMFWEQLRLNRRLNADSIRKIYAMMTPNKDVESKFRLLPTVDSDTYLSLDDLVKSYGLLTTAPWKEALTRIPDDQKRYISACLRKGETLENKPRITISTIHRAKGAQATNVLMTTDVPKRKSMLWRQEEFDDEARVFYVGLTRAKKELHLIHPMRSAGYAIPHGEACSPAA